MKVRMMEKINTPLKRIGLLTFIIGLLFFIIGVIALFINVRYDRYVYGYNESEYLLRYLNGLTYQVMTSLSFDIDSSSYNFFLGTGFYLTLIGFTFSFAYDRSVGRLISWIAKG